MRVRCPAVAKRPNESTDEEHGDARSHHDEEADTVRYFPRDCVLQVRPCVFSLVDKKVSVSQF